MENVFMKVANLPNDVLRPMLTQEVRRLCASIGHLLTTGVATMVVVALFMYIFGDFIGAKLPLVNQGIAVEAHFYFVLATILFAAAVMTRWLRAMLYTRHGWMSSLKMFGQTDERLNRLSAWTSATILAFGLTAVCLILNHFYGPLTAFHLAVAASLVPFASIYLRVLGFKSIEKIQNAPHSCQNIMEPPLVAWRNSRILSGRWSGANLRVLATLPILFGTTSLATHGPIELAQLCCLVGGIILSWTVPFLIAEDLRATWIERQSAVNHEQWIGAWQKIFWDWSKPIFITTAMLCFISQAVAHATAASSFSLLTSPDLTGAIGKSLLGGLLAAFPVWLAPAFIMQIDGRRVMTNIILLTLIGVFAGTALIAVPYLAPALYFLHREAHRYQGGRFARGSYN
jgi:hypothetical protein